MTTVRPTGTAPPATVASAAFPAVVDVARVPALRIGDAERSAAVTRLGDHHAAGRLDTAEFDERAAVAFAARTAQDLEVLFTDLPAPEPPPAPLRPHAGPPGPHGAGPLVAVLVAGILAAVAGMWTIWLLTGGGHPWPIYPMMGLVPLLAGATCGARRT
jgi:hypothetical protein